jgi:hypothetical protein
MGRVCVSLIPEICPDHYVHTDVWKMDVITDIKSCIVPEMPDLNFKAIR